MDDMMEQSIRIAIKMASQTDRLVKSDGEMS